MTKEEKQLLLKDLCARLPYGVKLDNGLKLRSVDALTQIVSCSGSDRKVDYVKPYLHPMSSMTEEEREYIKHRWCYNDWDIDGPSSLWREKIDVEDAEGIVDYFNEHHLDFRGLIPMGLALEAPEDMYKTS